MNSVERPVRDAQAAREGDLDGVGAAEAAERREQLVEREALGAGREGGERLGPDGVADDRGTAASMGGAWQDGQASRSSGFVPSRCGGYGGVLQSMGAGVAPGAESGVREDRRHRRRAVWPRGRRASRR